MCGGQNGWASSAYLTADDAATSPTPTPTPGGGGTGTYVTVDGTGGAGLRCRTAPSTGTVITLVADGTRLQTRGANSGGWIPVICGGQNGYVSASYVMVDVPAGSGRALVRCQPQLAVHAGVPWQLGHHADVREHGQERDSPPRPARSTSTASW